MNPQNTNMNNGQQAMPQQLNANLQNDIPNANWRDDLTIQDRARFVSQLGNALKQLSPTTPDNDIMAAAKNFELSLYTKSTSKNSYILAFARKFHQIKFQQNVLQAQAPQQFQQQQQQQGQQIPQTQQQLQLQQQQQQQQQQSATPNQTVAQPPQQQTQQTGQTPQQQQNQQAQMLALQRNAAQAMVAAAAANNGNNINASNNITPAQIAANVSAIQQQIPLNVLQNINMGNINQAALTLSPQQFQAYLARQTSITQQQGQQQQQQTPNNNMLNIPNNNQNQNQNFRPPGNAGNSPMNSFPNNGQQQISPEMLMQHLQAQQVRAQQEAQQKAQQLAEQQAQAQQEAQQKAQQLAQQQAQAQAKAQQEAQQKAQQLAQQQAQQLAQNQSQQPQQTPQLNMNSLPGNGNQQPQPNVPNRNITLQQRTAAAEIIRQMDETIRNARVHATPIEGLSEQEKASIREQTALMKPMYDKIDSLLPIFLAMTSNVEAARRLILMKYMFEDQLTFLGQNKYAMPLENLNKLKEQFSGYFSWVRSQAPNLMNGSPVPAPNNAMATNNASPVPEPSIGIKRGSIDLKLPANKKLKNNQSPALSNVSTPPQQLPLQQQTPQQQPQLPQQPLQQQNSPLRTGTSAAQAVDLTSPPSTQQQTQTQMVYQAAIASGLPPAIVNLLPPRALQCSWLLQQASQNRLNLTPQQLQQIRAMLNERVEAAKQQLAQQGQSVTIQQAATPPQVQQQPQASSPLVAMVQQQQASPRQPQVQQQQQQVPTPVVQQQAPVQAQQQQQPVPVQQQIHPPAVQAKMSPIAIQSPAKATPTMTPLRPGMGPDDKVVNTMMYANDVLKDVASILSAADKPKEPGCELKKVLENNRSALLFEPFPVKLDSSDDEEDIEAEVKKVEVEPAVDVSRTWYEVGMDTDVPRMSDIMSGFHWIEGEGYVIL